MELSSTEHVRQSFVIFRGNLESFHKKLSSLGLAPQYSAECRDGIERKFISIEELLDFENLKPSEITELRISAYSDDIKNRFHLHLSKRLRLKNVFLRIEGEDDVVLKASSLASAFLDDARPWYAVIAQRDLMNIMMALSFTGLAICLFIFLVAWYSRPETALDAVLPKGKQWVIGGTIGLAMVAVTLLVDFLRGSIFPLSTFAIGNGLNRHKNADIFRIAVVVSFAISLVSGIVTSLIMMSLFQTTS